MNTYLFVWNPSKWNWTNLEQCVEELNSTGKVMQKWSCRSFKTIKPGDRAFLVRVGVQPKGLIGSGVVTSPAFLSKHWSGDDKDVPRVLIQFDALLNAEEEPILTLDVLNQGNLSLQNWTPQSSGISIKKELLDELEAVWFDFLTTENIRHNPFSPTDVEEQTAFIEGAPKQVILTKYERNPFARKVCIEHYGLSCLVCGFNFEKVYGDIGKDFIHVHHLTHVAKVGKTYTVDPINDLRPVCPNCHAMLHRKKDGVAIDYLKSLMGTDQHSH